MLFLQACISPDTYFYRAHSTMSKHDIQNNYNIFIENDQDNQIGDTLNKMGLDLSQKPDAKKLLVKIFFYDIDDINIAPFDLRKTLNFKIIGIDLETKLAIFEVFTKLTTKRKIYNNSHNIKSDTIYRTLYYDDVISTRYDDFSMRAFNAFSNKKTKDKIMKEHTHFLIKQAIKLIGENVYIDNAPKSFNIDKFLQKNKNHTYQK